MSELCIIVVDRVNHECPYRDSKCYKRGDVIEVLEDGSDWGTETLRNPHWRILQLPNVPFKAALAFLSAEAETDPKNPSRVLQRRGFHFNIDAAPEDLKDWFADDSRAQPVFTSNMTLASLMKLKVRKPKRKDPNIL